MQVVFDSNPSMMPVTLRANAVDITSTLSHPLSLHELLLHSASTVQVKPPSSSGSLAPPGSDGGVVNVAVQAARNVLSLLSTYKLPSRAEKAEITSLFDAALRSLAMRTVTFGLSRALLSGAGLSGSGGVGPSAGLYSLIDDSLAAKLHTVAKTMIPVKMVRTAISCVPDWM